MGYPPRSLPAVGLDDVLGHLPLGDAGIHGLLFDVPVGLGLCHIETLDEQPLGPVHQADLLHALFHRLLLGLQLAQPLPQGAQVPAGSG